MSAPAGRRITPHPSPFAVGLDFLAQIRFPNGYHGCWVWTGMTTKRGYARHLSHLAARYALSGGPEPVPFRLRRVCGNRLCVSPLPAHHDWSSTPVVAPVRRAR